MYPFYPFNQNYFAPSVNQYPFDAPNYFDPQQPLLNQQS